MLILSKLLYNLSIQYFDGVEFVDINAKQRGESACSLYSQFAIICLYL